MKTRSIKVWAMLFILLVCLITMILFGYISFQSLKQNLELQYKQEADSVLNQTATSFDSSFQTVENFLEQLEQTIQLQQNLDSEEFKTLFNTYQSVIPSNGSLIYGYVNDRIYIGNDMEVPNDFKPFNREWYKYALLNKGDINWTVPYLDYFNQTLVISASKYINSANNNGVIGIDLQLNELSKIISNSSIGENGLVMLLNQDGTVIANRNSYLIGESIFGNEYRKIIEQSRMDYIPLEIDGKSYIIRSSNFKRNGMNIITAISEDELNNLLMQNLIPILVTGVICILIFSVIGYGLTLIWMRP